MDLRDAPTVMHDQPLLVDATAAIDFARLLCLAGNDGAEFGIGHIDKTDIAVPVPADVEAEEEVGPPGVEEFEVLPHQLEPGLRDIDLSRLALLEVRDHRLKERRGLLDEARP